MNVTELRNRVNAYRAQHAAQKAREEQAQAQLADLEKRIREKYGIEPGQLENELARLNAEIQTKGAELNSLLVSVGA